MRGKVHLVWCSVHTVANTTAMECPQASYHWLSIQWTWIWSPHPVVLLHLDIPWRKWWVQRVPCSAPHSHRASGEVDEDSAWLCPWGLLSKILFCQHDICAYFCKQIFSDMQYVSWFIRSKIRFQLKHLQDYYPNEWEWTATLSFQETYKLTYAREVSSGWSFHQIFREFQRHWLRDDSTCN